MHTWHTSGFLIGYYGVKQAACWKWGGGSVRVSQQAAHLTWMPSKERSSRVRKCLLPHACRECKSLQLIAVPVADPLLEGGVCTGLLSVCQHCCYVIS